MDLANDALAELDLVIGSVHSHMNLEAAEMTDRLLRALECPHLRILGHPTGRLLLQRDPFPFDFDRIVAEAVQPRRLAGNQRQPRAARPERPADPQRQGQGRAASPSPPTRTIPSTWPACATASSPRAAAGWGPAIS